MPAGVRYGAYKGALDSRAFFNCVKDWLPRVIAADIVAVKMIASFSSFNITPGRQDD